MKRAGWASLFALVALLACDRAPRVPYGDARAIVEKHCVSCHSANPTNPVFPVAPNGVALDTPEEMKKHAEKMKLRTIVDKSMPLLNKTNMTEEERALLGRWIDGGAKAR